MKVIPEMDKNDLKTLHECILIIADEINRICEKNDIKYSLIAGSLLGAIRHKGFIPWDDDMDIGLLRDEYDHFLEACSRDLDSSRFELQNIYTDPYYTNGFSKILLKGTNLVQYGHEKTKYKKGIFVDVFPYDAVPEDEKLKNKHNKTNYLLIKMLQEKSGVTANVNWGIKQKVVYKLLDIVVFFFNKDKLVRMLDKNMSKYKAQSTEYVSNMGGFYGYDKETLPTRIFKTHTKLQFEDREYSAVVEYDEFLRIMYHDYMSLPPVEKRRTHAFRELDFGDYRKNSTDY